MQKLYFENAWEQTIAHNDRKKITEHFKTIQQQDEKVLSFLWKATNHKDETLVTVLIHNPELTPLNMSGTPIAYISQNGATTINTFDLPIEIPAESSMPWTFIFPEHQNIKRPPHFIIQEK